MEKIWTWLKSAAGVVATIIAAIAAAVGAGWALRQRQEQTRRRDAQTAWERDKKHIQSSGSQALKNRLAEIERQYPRRSDDDELDTRSLIQRSDALLAEWEKMHGGTS